MKRQLIPTLFTAAMLTGCATIDTIANLGEPAFKVVKQDGNVEIREYRSMIVAEAIVAGSLNDASGDGFRAIGGYIFGANIAKSNSSSEKITMTAPVTVERESEKIPMIAPVTMEPGAAPNRRRMHFVIPGKYTLATLPTPRNPAVKLREIAPQRVAVNRFSGFSGETKVAEKLPHSTRGLPAII